MGIELGAYLQGQIMAQFASNGISDRVVKQSVDTTPDEVEERQFKVVVECNSCGSNNCKITAQDQDVFIDCLDCREGAMDYKW